MQTHALVFTHTIHWILFYPSHTGQTFILNSVHWHLTESFTWWSPTLHISIITLGNTFSCKDGDFFSVFQYCPLSFLPLSTFTLSTLWMQHGKCCALCYLPVKLQQVVFGCEMACSCMQIFRLIGTKDQRTSVQDLVGSIGRNGGEYSKLWGNLLR